MKKLALILSTVAFSMSLSAAEQVKSPDGRVVVNFYLSDGGVPTYSATFAGEQIIKPSHMGFILADSTKLPYGARTQLYATTTTALPSTWRSRGTALR